MLRKEKNINYKNKPLLLFCALNWGLGHVTRSIPILKEFGDHGWNIVVACNSTQKKIFEGETEGWKFIEKQSPTVEYGRNQVATRAKIVFKLIKILMNVNAERRWIARILTENKVDLIVSDNCYGAFSPSVPSIFITHQLKPRSGFGSVADSLVQTFLKKYINRFTQCWIPDYQNGRTLTGELSHSGSFPSIPVKFLGPVSRLQSVEINHPPTVDLLIIISGPEPQRSIFENIIVGQLRSFAKQREVFSVVIIRGLPGKNQPRLDLDAQQFNHVTAQQLSELAGASQFVISRSGYTTIMDMLKLKKKMILVPTPGQTEQEYLAAHLEKNKMAVAANQHNFSLEKIIRKAELFDYNFPDGVMNDYKKVIRDFNRELFPNYFS